MRSKGRAALFFPAHPTKVGYRDSANTATVGCDMKNQIINILAVLALATTAWAEGKAVFNPSDTVATAVSRQVGQRVELRLKSGDKLVGKLEAVGDKAVHLSALTGQEFFDAVVALDDISAVIVRTGGK